MDKHVRKHFKLGQYGANCKAASMLCMWSVLLPQQQYRWSYVSRLTFASSTLSGLWESSVTGPFPLSETLKCSQRRPFRKEMQSWLCPRRCCGWQQQNCRTTLDSQAWGPASLNVSPGAPALISNNRTEEISYKPPFLIVHYYTKSSLTEHVADQEQQKTLNGCISILW